MGLYGRLGWFKRPGKAERIEAMKSLAQVGMEEYATRQISQLSGGQQQRVFLARALVQDARVTNRFKAWTRPPKEQLSNCFKT